jgi:protein-tyrosine-phosphatase
MRQQLDQKSWDEYRDVVFDFVITVCDNAKEQCPFWPGQPIVAHWPSPDPAGFRGDDRESPSQKLFRNLSGFVKLARTDGETVPP